MVTVGDTWGLSGEGIVALASSVPATRLPAGVKQMPGPSIVSALRYVDSSVGPFLELAVSVPARAAGRLGWCRVLVVVDRSEVRTAVRAQWGLPVEMGKLRWLARDEHRELVWEDREIVVRGRGRGAILPWLAFQPLFLERHHEPVVAAGRYRGTLKLARVQVQTFPGDELSPLAGWHAGAVLRGVHHRRGPARIVRTGHLLTPRHHSVPEPVMCEPVA